MNFVVKRHWLTRRWYFELRNANGDLIVPPVSHKTRSLCMLHLNMVQRTNLNTLVIEEE